MPRESRTSGNPWLDAGIVPFSTLRWRHDRSYWEHWFPADFVVESFPGQFRNWFYSLLAMSAMLAGRAPFRTLLGHALVRDQWGRPMHKSEGNSIPFEGVADDGYVITNPSGAVEKQPPVGADVVRWVFARHNPTNNISFGAGPADEVRNKVVLKVWNTYAFFCNYARLDGFDPAEPATPFAERTDLDRWIVSDLQLLIGLARRQLRIVRSGLVLSRLRAVHRRAALQLVCPPQSAPILEKRGGARQACSLPNHVRRPRDPEQADRAR